MKVVLFCGGMGMRLREYSDSVPKPMVPIGNRPVMLNLMKYYAHHGHKEFILCLGHKGEVIKEYFMGYKEYLTNDFTISQGGRTVNLFNSDIDDWKITFADTGLTSNIGQRLLRARKYLGDDEVFLANYSDGLCDFDLPKLVEPFTKKKWLAGFLSVRPNQTYHIVQSDEGGTVSDIHGIAQKDLWFNGGFFVLHRDIFNYMNEGEELVEAPFKRLIAEGKLGTVRHEGFWMPMDTFKDKQTFDELYTKGKVPWEVWRQGQNP